MSMWKWCMAAVTLSEVSISATKLGREALQHCRDIIWDAGRSLKVTLCWRQYWGCSACESPRQWHASSKCICLHAASARTYGSMRYSVSLEVVPMTSCRACREALEARGLSSCAMSTGEPLRSVMALKCLLSCRVLDRNHKAFAECSRHATA